MSNIRVGDSIKVGVISWLLRTSANTVLKLVAILLIGCIVEMGCSFVLAAVMPIAGYGILDSIRNMNFTENTIKTLGALMPDVGDMFENLVSLFQNSSIATLKMPENIIDDIVGALVLSACSGLFGYLYTIAIAPICNCVTRCKGKIIDLIMTLPIMMCSIRIAAIIANVIVLFMQRVYSYATGDGMRLLLAVVMLIMMLLILVGIVWMIGATKSWFGTFVNSLSRVLLNALMGVIIYELGVSIINYSNGWNTMKDTTVIIFAPLAIMYIFVSLRINSLNPLK